MAGNLAPTNIMDVANYVQQQGNLGRQQGLQSRFARLAGQAYTAPAGADRTALLGRAVQTDPSAGIALGNQLAARDSAQQATQKAAEVDHAKKLRGAAQFALAALKSGDPARIQGASNAIGPYLTQLTGKQFTGLDESMLPGIYQILAQTGGEDQQKGVVLSAGGQLRNPMTGELLADNPQSLQYHDVPMGQGKAAGVFDPSTGQLRPAAGAAQPPTGDPMQPFIAQANQAVQLGADPAKVEQWLLQQARQMGGQPRGGAMGAPVPVSGADQPAMPQPQAAPAQFGVGTPAGPKPQNETWNQPVDETGPDGKPIRVQYSNTGERRVVEGAAPIAKPNAGAAKKSDEQIKVALYTKGLADDAYAYAAAATGRTQDELRQMTPEQVAALVAQGSRWSSGPVVGRIPGMNPLANADLSAYANSASGKMARMNNPTGPVSNADFEIAAKSVWGPDKPDAVNAQLILNALQREQAMQAGSAAAPNSAPPPPPAQTVAPRPRATNPQTGETVEFDGQQWVPVHG